MFLSLKKTGTTGIALAVALSAAAAAAQSGYDPVTGLFVAPGHRLVAAHCTACHSARLITQQGATEQGWREMIEWMQDEQGLWPIDEASLAQIIAYLATHYGPDRPHWK